MTQLSQIIFCKQIHDIQKGNMSKTQTEMLVELYQDSDYGI